MEYSEPLLSLPTELLAYIFSFLPTTRDKAKIRCVSSRLRNVMEKPSLWSEFVWPYYDSREKHCVCNLLKSFGGHIKTLSFPDHVPPIEIFQHCVNVTRFDLTTQPTVKLSPSEIRTAIKHMVQLQKLDDWVVPNNSAELLLDCAKIEELTIRIQVPRLPANVHTIHMSMRILQLRGAVHSVLLKWKENGFLPSNLSIICCDDISSFIDEILGSWPASKTSLPIGHVGKFRLYSNCKVALDLYPTLPMLQLQFGQGTTVPCVDPSKLGLVALKNDVVTLSNCGNDSSYKAALWKGSKSINNYHFNNISISLNSVTLCDLSFTFKLDYNDLDQLAQACPNLQRLDISHTNCLAKLQGLRSIADGCRKLQGLNLTQIQVEDHMQLWEILSDIKLTHLAVELGVIFPFKDNSTYSQNLGRLYKKFIHLKALHLAHNEQSSCKFDDQRALLLSHFPSLTCCLLDEVPYQCSDIMKNILINCKELKYFRCCYSKSVASIKPSLSFACNLTQLLINSVTAQLTDSFMSTVSSHGGLEHVLFHVLTISQEGLAKLIKNSPKLLTFHVGVHAIIQEDPELLLQLGRKCQQLDPDDVKTELKEMFSNKKLFHVDGLYIKKGPVRMQLDWEELNIDVTLNLF